MNRIAKSAGVIGQVIDLFLGQRSPEVEQVIAKNYAIVALYR